MSYVAQPVKSTRTVDVLTLHQKTGSVLSRRHCSFLRRRRSHKAGPITIALSCTVPFNPGVTKPFNHEQRNKPECQSRTSTLSLRLFFFVIDFSSAINTQLL